MHKINLNHLCLTHVRACSETLAADILGIFEEFGIASVDGKPFEVLGMVDILELEQKLNEALFCLGRKKGPFLMEVQAALWAIEELLYLIGLWNDVETKKLDILDLCELANDE